MTYDVRWTPAWKKLRAQVIHEEPTCWLQFPGCTHVSTQGDHIIPPQERPDLALLRSNVRGACAPCNLRRGRVPVGALRIDDEPPPALGVFD